MDSSCPAPLAITVLEKRYLRKNTQVVVVVDPDDMFWRVALDIAEAEHLYRNSSSIDELSRTFHRLMASLDFLPNSPCLMNAGKELQQLAAWFVLLIEDSLESIFETVKQTALIHQSDGRARFPFSDPRPKANTGQVLACGTRQFC